MLRRKALEQERRRYIRLDSVFPVQFRLISLDTKEVSSDWQQGFTNNIGKGGLCLQVNHLKADHIRLLKDQQVKLSLLIEMPLATKPVSALSQIAWFKEEPEYPRYLIGLSYEEIAWPDNRRILRYAWAKRLFVPVVLGVILVLGLGLTVNSYINVKLIKGNKALVEQFINILQESSIAKQKVKEISKDKEDLQIKMQLLQTRIKNVEEEKKSLEEKVKLQEKEKLEQEGTAAKITELNSQIAQLIQEKASLQEQLIAIQHKENVITEELLRLDKKKATLEKANLDKMYKWLVIHQNPRTGLVMSFEGDSEIANWAFSYDQSLVAQAYTKFSDFERAKKILEFFAKKAKRAQGLFFNAYYVNDGEPAEYTVHAGPNIWVGIAALQYVKKTQDTRYLPLAEEVALQIMNLQKQDKDGALRGGPGVEWYSTEHNLDAYAFLNMLYKITGKPQYAEGRDKILNWLLTHTYDKMEIPVKRGKGDSTIATDTYAWSIAAIGPEKLAALELNPDRIVEFAEENCSVEVAYARPEGHTVKVKGFDFAPQRHLARGGVVSSEWTAQMVMAFRIMADFYYKKEMVAKARGYALKADEYLVELSNMIISSPSPSGQGESCLPYATQDFVDTGHGWMTPKGKSTGSVSGTAYTIFAYYNYNPLELKD